MSLTIQRKIKLLKADFNYGTYDTFNSLKDFIKEFKNTIIILAFPFREILGSIKWEPTTRSFSYFYD